MSDTAWLTIIGMTAAGPDGLARPSQEALAAAEVVMGPPRHLEQVPRTSAERIDWPVPFTDGIDRLMGLRGRKVVVLVSGDPFWFGAGSVITRKLTPGEWVAIPAPSTFSLAAARLGWPLETTVCLGLHAQPLSRLRAHLHSGARLIVLVRDGPAVRDLTDYLASLGFGDSCVTVLESLDGPGERIRQARAVDHSDDFSHPVCVAIEAAGDEAGLSLACGLPDALFESDGQITKRPMRALTLSALAPCPGQMLWDIGGGSGSIAIEWLLCHPTMQAISIESRAERAARISQNAGTLGVDRLRVVTGTAPGALADLPRPDAIFIGGGLSDELLRHLVAVAPGAHVVANGVTLEAEALLARWQASHGGDLMRIDLAYAQPLGAKRGWRAAYPVVQWSVTL